jgi:hypothetical protein
MDITTPRVMGIVVIIILLTIVIGIIIGSLSISIDIIHQPQLGVYNRIARLL